MLFISVGAERHLKSVDSFATFQVFKSPATHITYHPGILGGEPAKKRSGCPEQNKNRGNSGHLGQGGKDHLFTDFFVIGCQLIQRKSRDKAEIGRDQRQYTRREKRQKACDKRGRKCNGLGQYVVVPLINVWTKIIQSQVSIKFLSAVAKCHIGKRG